MFTFKRDSAAKKLFKRVGGVKVGGVRVGRGRRANKKVDGVGKSKESVGKESTGTEKINKKE